VSIAKDSTDYEITEFLRSHLLAAFACARRPLGLAVRLVVV